MSFTLAQIAQALGVEFHGDGGLVIDRLAEPADAGPRDLALAMDKRFGAGLTDSKALAAIVWADADWQALGLQGAIQVARAGAVMPALTRLMDRAPEFAAEVHPTAIIDPTARIGADARIGPYTVIGADVQIGAGVRIASHVSIAPGVHLGANALLHAGVRLQHDLRIGDNFICHPNTVIGGDGFSFKKTDRVSSVEQLRGSVGRSVGKTDRAALDTSGSAQWQRVASLGAVVIGDDVEIGASSSIDAGTIRATAIGSGTKIDNQVQIGHNVVIGRDCLVCGDASIAGSTRIGDRVVVGGSSKISDNIFVGDDVIIAGASVLFTNVPAKRQVWGSPAVKIETQMAINRELRRLPRLAAQMRAFLQQQSPPKAKTRDKN